MWFYFIYRKTSILWRAKRLAKYPQYNKALLNQVFFGVTETIVGLLLCCGVGITFSLLYCIIGWLHVSTTPRNYHHFEVLFHKFYYWWGKECCSLLSRTLLYRCLLYRVANIVEAFFLPFFLVLHANIWNNPFYRLELTLFFRYKHLSVFLCKSCCSYA